MSIYVNGGPHQGEAVRRNYGEGVPLIGRRIPHNATRERTVGEELRHEPRPAFDGAVIPGGFSPEYLRRDPHLVALVRRLVEAGKPVAAICHGPWLLLTAGVLAGRRVTSFPTLRPEIEYAGATWIDERVVVDGPLITSRTAADLPAFLGALLRALES